MERWSSDEKSSRLKIGRRLFDVDGIKPTEVEWGEMSFANSTHFRFVFQVMNMWEGTIRLGHLPARHLSDLKLTARASTLDVVRSGQGKVPASGKQGAQFLQ